MEVDDTIEYSDPKTEDVSSTKDVHPPDKEKSYLLSTENKIALADLGDILKPIVDRMRNEGYKIINGALNK